MKYLYITHLSGKRVNRLWLSALKAAQSLGYEIHLACNMDEIVKPEWDADCLQYEITAHHIDFDRNPLARKNKKAHRQLLALMHKEKFDLVQCNTPIGGVLGRLCAKKAQIPHVIYQAHGFHFWKGAPLKNWLLYYPVEKWLSQYTDVLITINKEDYKRAKKFNAGKVCYVPGVGIDLKKFNAGCVDKNQKRKEINLHADDFVMLSVGELIPRKNHEVVIRAMSVLMHNGQIGNLEYVICGCGTYESELKQQAKELSVDTHVHFLGYRNDIAEICNCSDIFVFMSYQEGLPVALMEAMACGLPVICSSIRGNTDLIEDEITGLISPNTPDDVAKAINIMKECKELRLRLASAAFQKIKQFDLSCVEAEMTKIYGGWMNCLALKEIYEGQRIRKELGIPLGAKVVLSVGEVNKNKNHKVGIEALAKLNDKNVYYVICGRGPLTEVHRALAQSLKVDNRVIFTGYRTDVEKFYKMADVFLFPSFREGLPVVVMEAMAARLPCVASRIRGNTDLLGNGYKYYFEPSQSDKLAAMLTAIYADRSACGQYCHERSKLFDICVVAEQMKTIYSQTLK